MLTHPVLHPEVSCELSDPVALAPKLHGVTFRYRAQDSERAAYAFEVACPMALALDQFAEWLAERGVREVQHLGVYNCRMIGGASGASKEASPHASAMAIDIVAAQDETLHEVEADWFDRARGQWWNELVDKLDQRAIWSVILTPDYDAAHHNHLHLDLSATHFVSRSRTRWTWIAAALLALAGLAGIWVIRRRRS